MPDATGQDALDRRMMLLALAEARKCEPKPTAFCVGCVIVLQGAESQAPVILARGYSREIEGNTHAEANALEKIRKLTDDELSDLLSSSSECKPQPSVGYMLRSCVVYTTMEPCSVRTSGLSPCADALIAAGVSRCVIGVGEPDDFVICEGAEKLKSAGVQVVWLNGLERECLEVARRDHL